MSWVRRMKQTLYAEIRSASVSSFLNDRTTGAPANWRNDQREQVRNFTSHVYAAVSAIAKRVARQRPLVGQDVVDGEVVNPVNPKHPLRQLLVKPNPLLSYWELAYLKMVYLHLTGNAYVYLPQASFLGRKLGTPVEQWPLPSHWMQVIPGNGDTPVAGYELRNPATGAKQRFDPEEIMHYRFPGPDDQVYGWSPLQAMAMSVDVNNELLAARYYGMKHGQRPDLILTTEQTLTDPVVRRLEERLFKKLAGAANYKMPLVLEQGLKASPWSLSPAEMDFLNSAELTRNEIFGIYGVPPVIAGYVENIGLGGQIWLGADTVFCNATINPLMGMVGEQETIGLAQRFFSDEELTVHYPDCVTVDDASQREWDALHLRTGLRTYDELRVRDGLQPYGGIFSKPLVPTNVIPMDSVEDVPTTDTAPPPGKQITRSFSRKSIKIKFLRDHRSVEIGLRRTVRRYLKVQQEHVISALDKLIDANGGVPDELRRLLAEGSLVDLGPMPKDCGDDAGYTGNNVDLRCCTVSQRSWTLRIDQIFDHDAEDKALSTRARPYLLDAAAKGALLELQRSHATKSMDDLEDIDIDLAPEIIEDIRGFVAASKDARHWSSVNDTTLAKLSKQLEDGILAGESKAQLLKRVREVYTLRQFEAERIVRTEITGVMNYGANQTRARLGISRKEWLATADDATRDAHEDADGQQVSNDEPFDVGGEQLEYPGDPNGSPSNIINCRCGAIGVFENDNDEES